MSNTNPPRKSAKLVESILQLIEHATRRKLHFPAVVNLKTGETSGLQDRICEMVDKWAESQAYDAAREAE